MEIKSTLLNFDPFSYSYISFIRHFDILSFLYNKGIVKRTFIILSFRYSSFFITENIFACVSIFLILKTILKFFILFIFSHDQLIKIWETKLVKQTNIEQIGVNFGAI